MSPAAGRVQTVAAGTTQDNGDRHHDQGDLVFMPVLQEVRDGRECCAEMPASRPLIKKASAPAAASGVNKPNTSSTPATISPPALT